MFEPVNRRTLVEKLIDKLLEMIAKGDLRPGYALPSERELASKFGVSRTSIREALKAISFDGIVVIKPGSGTYLTDKALTAPLSLTANAGILVEKHLHDYNQIIEVRRIIEVEASVLAATRVTDELVTKLEASLLRMGQLLEQNRYDAYSMEDLAFHNQIVLGSNNEFLYNAYDRVFSDIVEVARLGETIPGRHLPSYDQHKEIFNAIKAGDPEAVRTHMQAHINFCEESMNLYFLDLDSQELI